MYEPFGVSWIDGLDSFESIGANYCLVHRSSTKIITKVQQYQEASLEQIRVKIISEKYNELMTYAMQPKERIISTKKHYQDEIKRFMSPENQSFDIEVAFPCDIDLEWLLVPKTWVR